MNTIKDMDTIVILQPGSVQVVLHRDTHGNDHTFTNRRLYQVIDDVDTTRSVFVPEDDPGIITAQMKRRTSKKFE